MINAAPHNPGLKLAIGVLFATLSSTACVTDAGEEQADENFEEVTSEITARATNYVHRGDGLCLWRGSQCVKMNYCESVWVDSVNWSAGSAWVYHYRTGLWGSADKNYLTTGYVPCGGGG